MIQKRVIRFLTKHLIGRLGLNDQGELAELVLERMVAKQPSLSVEPLMRLDWKLYELQSQAAIAANDGIHPKHRLTRYHEFFVNRILPRERVLDFGTGVGAVAYDVAEAVGAQVDGIDIVAENIQVAKSRFSHPCVQYFEGNGLQLSPAPPYDVVIMSNVLEHLVDRPEALKSIQENSQAKRFLIRVPCFERDWRVPHKKELGVEWRLDQDHKIEFTEEEFRTEMAAAELEIVHFEMRWGEIWSELRVPEKIHG